MTEKPYRFHPTSSTGPSTPPQYARVTASLSDRELDAELQTERGKTDKEWRRALLAEQKKRGKVGARR